ncbi:transcriptional regulator, AraC family [Acinetobacter marinus]|uniref:Transcriptional regulator, AraC family n=1 Tax=Acinetobacter marinus TaxID=281375 RepID=A0A1G6GMK8_9GAMM|nr:AraC family transcriptional regulator ligand-binding domain-containing protein [Acinetobacter marinus]SDB83073.1 transcriptional regulator, AraC family [Acinetobacter marinus]
MSKFQHAFECDYRYIPAHHQLSILMDICHSHDISHDLVLRGSGIFLEDILSAKKRISVEQIRQVLKNISTFSNQHDIHFLFGQRTLITPFHEAQHSLLYANSIAEALQRYVTFSSLLCPWLTPQLFESQQHLYLYWLDENNPDSQHLIESAMSAIQALTRQLYGQKLPWHYEFHGEEPEYIEQYWVHLGDHVEFNRPMNMMILDRQYLYTPLPNASSILAQTSHKQALSHFEMMGIEQSFLTLLYHYLMQNIQHNIQLEHTAEYFAMSPATLKRKLKKHHTHFQAQVDQCRLHTAIKLYRIYGYKTEQVSEYLQINDANNFRRAFKRWSGISPQAI